MMDDETVLAAARSDPTGLMRALERTTIDEVQASSCRRSSSTDFLIAQRKVRGGRFPLNGVSHYIPGSDDGLERYILQEGTHVRKIEMD
jgi:hypothetical protein